MPIIFGWGKQTISQVGIVFKNLCGNCHNEEYWVLKKTTKWFTLFFIPIIPYSTEYFLSCPICTYGITLDGVQIEQLRPIAEANQALIEGEIDEKEHQSRLHRLQSGSSERVDAHVVESEVLEAPKSSTGGNDEPFYCTQCGIQVTKDIKFCGNCGSEIIS